MTFESRRAAGRQLAAALQEEAEGDAVVVGITRGGGHHVTLDTSYKFIALPAGIFVLIVSFAALFILWLRRKLASHT